MDNQGEWHHVSIAPAHVLNVFPHSWMATDATRRVNLPCVCKRSCYRLPNVDFFPLKSLLSDTFHQLWEGIKVTGAHVQGIWGMFKSFPLPNAKRSLILAILQVEVSRYIMLPLSLKELAWNPVSCTFAHA
jgi:hypothetical protein